MNVLHGLANQAVALSISSLYGSLDCPTHCDVVKTKLSISRVWKVMLRTQREFVEALLLPGCRLVRVEEVPSRIRARRAFRLGTAESQDSPDRLTTSGREKSDSLVWCTNLNCK